MVSEVAVAGANKGLALDAFMAEPPFAGRTPFVAGDDTTDEDAFEAAERRGGLALKIGHGPSVATLRVPVIEDFLDWLHRAAES
jgi:trehalose 6-phosphate phosphatase